MTDPEVEIALRDIRRALSESEPSEGDMSLAWRGHTTIARIIREKTQSSTWHIDAAEALDRNVGMSDESVHPH